MPDSYMQFNSHSDDMDVVAEVLKQCGCSVTNYPLKDIARRYNFALDWYFTLAFLHGKGWNFQDINQTSPPIDSQNIVSGTNRYKFSDFTNKIIGAIRVELLTAAGKGKYLDRDDFRNLAEPNEGNESGRIADVGYNTFQEKYVDAAAGTPDQYCVYGDYIYLNKKPDYNESNGLKIYFNQAATHIAPTATDTPIQIPIIHAKELCRYTAIPYLRENKIISKSEAQADIAEMERSIAAYFGQIRSQDRKPRLIARQESCR